MRNSRYRRDQRQLDEDEEMWFNEEEDFDEGEAVVPAASADLVPPASAKKQPPSPTPTPNPIPADSKSQQQQTVLNNNTSSSTVTTPQTQVNNSPAVASESLVSGDISPSTTVSTVEKTGTTIFKKVRVFHLAIKVELR